MKQKTLLTVLLYGILLSFSAACSNEDKENRTDGKVDITKDIEFRLSFSDYNDEQEIDGTRAVQQESVKKQETVDLGNGMLAIVTMQKDTAKTIISRKEATRALPNDTYTMLAYDHATHAFKGEVTGTVTGSVFQYSGNKGIDLDPGTYDFVLFNSKVSRNGNQLTVTRADAETALIGRTENVNITAMPKTQKVNFTMRHAGARMRIKLTGYMPILASTAATLTSTSATAIPTSSVYDASANTWNAMSGATVTEQLVYPASTETDYISPTHTSINNKYLYFVPTTDVAKLKLTFTGGMLYKMNMSGASLVLKPTPTLTMEANHSYLVNVKLMYNYLYLMSDGTTGFFQETTYGGGEKTPIGLVFSQSRHLAMALKDAPNGHFPWDGSTGWQPTPGDNTTLFYTPTDMFNDMDGYKWTWDPNGTYDHTTIKANSSRYPAFYAAGHYTPTLPTGVTLTGSIVGKHWHLPSHGEWKLAVGALGFGDISNLNAYDINRLIYGYLWDIAFTQVGGDVLCRYGTKRYWTSTEDGHYNIPILEPNLTYMRMLWTADTRTGSNYIRPVIIY